MQEDDNKERLPTSRDPWTQDEIAISWTSMPKA